MKKWQLGIVAGLALLVGIGVNWLSKNDFTTLEGQAYKWRELHGQWVVVNYFASWCAPCLREMPELNQFAAEYPQYPIFALSFDPKSAAELRTMAMQFQITFPVIAELDSAPWQAIPSTLPHTIIIDPQGKVVAELKGEQSALGLAQTIAKLQGA